MRTLTIASVITAFSSSVFAQAGAEACKTISRGIDRLECYDKAYGVERKLADPIPAVKVRSTTIMRERAPEQPAQPKSPQ